MMRIFKGLTVCSCLAFALFYGDCWGMDGEGLVEETSSDADSSVRSVSSLSSEEEDMIQQACYDKRAVVQLLAYLQSKPYEEACAIYRQALQEWNDENAYEFVDTGSSFKGYYEKDCYDF